MTTESDEKALNLFLASVPMSRIKQQLAYRSITSAEAAIRRALKTAQAGKTADTARQIEIERLDTLYRATYTTALAGDQKAIDLCLKIGEQRLRLLDAPEKRAKGLQQAYEQTIKSLSVGDEDTAVIQTGRMIAQQIDYTVTHGTGQEVTKALYLVPHLMNVLTALGATPQAREQLKEMTPPGSQSIQPLDDLTAFRMKHVS